MAAKPILYLIIDALNPSVIVPAMQAGKLPMLARLAEAGVFREQCHSVFPSITPAATAALVTGAYPRQSSISGACWYDRAESQLAYYGADLNLILQLGFAEFIHGFLTRLNQERLQTETLYAQLHRSGITTTNINLMWFHGPHRHAVELPWLMQLEAEVRGPDQLFLGDFVRGNHVGTKLWSEQAAGLSNKYGFNDHMTRLALTELIQQEALTDFNVVYFPDNDFESHKVGPGGALPVIEKIDRYLQRLAEQCGSFDRFLNSYSLIITGDHSQSAIHHEPIDLPKLAKDIGYTCNLKGNFDQNEIVICPNLRAAAVYLPDAASQGQNFARKILQDDRIDQVILSCHHDDSFMVLTKDRGELKFWPDENGTPDEYQGRWCLEGNLTAVDAAVFHGQVQYGNYPNALERIACGFTCASGDLWITARPGYEFQVNEISTHRGGSHGSLHRDDSTSMLIATDVSDHLIPAIPRIVDLPAIIRHQLGEQQAALQIGRSHIQLLPLTAQASAI